MDDTVTHSDETMYYRGSHIVPSVVKTLNELHNMSEATTVVLSGTSAGGLGTIHNCDKVSDMLDKPDASVYCVVDAGYFFGYKDFESNEAVWSTKWHDVVTTHMSTDALSHECRGDLGEEKWMCYLANVALQYTKTPIFLIQSVMDMWQLQYNYFSTSLDDDDAGTDATTKAGHDCLYNPLRMCTAGTFAGIQDFRETMLEMLKKTAGHNQNVSYFVDCCFKHAQTDRNKPFKVPSVHGEDMSMALHRWLNLDHREHTHGVIQTRTVDTEAWPHAGQKCDWGPEWQQFIKNDAFEMSNGDFVGQFVDSDPSS